MLKIPNCVCVKRVRDQPCLTILGFQANMSVYVCDDHVNNDLNWILVNLIIFIIQNVSFQLQID